METVVRVLNQKILKYLREKDGFVSGEEISSNLGVSRTAIWKHIKELKSEGYIIDSSSKKGYRLLEAPDRLTAEEVLPMSSAHYIGKNIVHFESAGSTNIEARQLANEGCEEGTTVIAEEQTSGRGRLGRSWSTPKSKSIAFSMVLRPNIKPEDAPGITLLMGTAVCRALRKAAVVDAYIKWPNDIIVNKKKICGILTEMNAEMDAVNYIIVGVGINVNIEDFPEDLKGIATSLYIETGKETSRKHILSAVFSEFEMLYDKFKSWGISSIIDEFKSYSITLGRQVRVTSINESFTGEAVDITPKGLLVIKLNDGSLKTVISGDVSVRGINGYI